MPAIIEITDLSSPELEVYTSLTRAQLCSPQAGPPLMIAESPHVIEAALDAGYAPVSMLMERKKAAALQGSLLARCGDIPVYTADREVLAALTGYALTRGVLCAMRRKPLPAMDAVCAGAKRIALLEGIVDTTNMGAIFRSAAALHMDGVLLSPTCCDPLSRRALRVSMGSVFKVPWTLLTPEDGAWPQGALSRLRGMGFACAAMALRDDSLCVDAPVLKAQERLCILLGSEGHGLADDTIAQCDYTVKIPMNNGVDSLNVAAASAVAFWEMGKRA